MPSAVELDATVIGAAHRVLAARFLGERRQQHTIELTRLVGLRERLRDHLTARTVEHDGGTPSTVPTDLFPALTIRIAADPEGHLTFTSAEHPGVDAFLVELASALVVASATGTLTRLKTCTNPHCRWAYYDWSRNTGGRWCSMQACGGRHKARTYRRRRVDGDPDPAPTSR